MALAERMLAARFNRPGHDIVDHHTYVIASDGDLQEGVASEAVVARRPPRPRPPDRLLRRQPHLDRGRHRALVHRGRRQALRGLRLARPEPRRGHRRSSASRRRWPTRARSTDKPSLIIVRTPHRARLAEQAGHARRARLAARRRGDPAHQGGLRLARARSRSSSPTRRSRTSASAVARGEELETEWNERFEAYRPTTPSWPPSSSASSSTAACPRAGTPTCPRRARTPA